MFPNQAVILAAGQSSRFWPLNTGHKSLIKIMGRPLIWYTLEALKRNKIKEVIIVQGAKRDIEEGLCTVNTSGIKIRYATQQKPRGTGDALYQAKKFIKSPFFFVTGPHKVDLNDYLPQILSKHRRYPRKMLLVGAKTVQPWDFGIFKFKGSKISQIIENPPKGKEPSDIKATESYLLPAEFFSCYETLPRKEDSLIDAINIIIKKDGAELVLLKKEAASLKYPWDSFGMFKILVEAGWLRSNIAASAYIGKNVVLDGTIHIGAGTKILENIVVRGPVYIGDNCTIGNSVVIRANTSIEDGALLGAFAEVKSSILQDNVHMHSGYLGDSIVGKGCRMGAGMITANRRIDRQNIKVQVKGERIDTGLSYFGAVVGEDTKIGIHVSLMPGVLVGARVVVGPHSMVRENIPDDTLFYSKFKFHLQRRR